jgi:hypothetical protein
MGLKTSAAKNVGKRKPVQLRFPETSTSKVFAREDISVSEGALIPEVMAETREE